MKRIKVRNINKYIIIDDCFYKKLCKFKWRLSVSTNGSKRIVTGIYNKKTKIQRNVGIHEFIIGKIKGKIIDHIDMNVFNNKKSNLRFCSYSQNNMNKNKSNSSFYGTTSKYKGVHFDKQSKKYRALIYKDKKRYCLGFFINEKDAAKAYNKKAKEIHGEFARLNKWVE